MVGMPSLIFRCVPGHAMLVPTLLVATLLAGGCAPLDVPRAEVFPATGQKKARAVHHWDVLADDVAAQIAQKIAAWPAGQHPIHVSGANESSFSQGFRKLLTVRLLDRGVPLSAAPAAVELVLDAQLVQHQTAGSMGLQLPGTVLSEGVSVARDVQLPAYGEMLDAPADKAAEVLHGTHDSGLPPNRSARKCSLQRCSEVEIVIWLDRRMFITLTGQMRAYTRRRSLWLPPRRPSRGRW